jgi:dihydroneopterin aldolase
MDRVTLQGVGVYAHHGVHPAERELGQRFVIDVTLWTDCEAAARSDDVAAAVDYARVHRRVCAVAVAEPCQLLEAVARRLCRALLEEFPVARVVVTVAKPQPPIPGFHGDAAVTLERDREWLRSVREESP